MLNTHGMSKKEILQALYAGARPQGMGFMHFVEGDLRDDDAERYVESQDYYDYLKGRAMKISLTELNPALYDRYNGPGAAQNALDEFFTRPK